MHVPYRKHGGSDMKVSPHNIEIFLQPGEFYFGERDARIRTVLGSCVSITLWHPRLLIGGMCHYMLPHRNGGAVVLLDGRYADEAMQLFMREILVSGTRPDEYQVKLFGGGRMFLADKRRELCGLTVCTKSTMNNCRDVSCKNVQIARILIRQHGFSITAEHLGGNGHRQLMFDIVSGDAWVKHKPIATSFPSGMAA